MHGYKGASTLFNQARDPGQAADDRSCHRRRPDREVQVRRPPLDDRRTCWSPATRSSRSAGDDGSFKINGVPAGKLHGRGLARALWHEDRGDHGRRRQARRRPFQFARALKGRPARSAPAGEAGLRWTRKRSELASLSAINAPDVASRRQSGAQKTAGTRVVHRFAVATAVATYPADPDRRPGSRHGLQPRLPRLADLLRHADAQDGGRRADRAQPPAGGGDRRHPDAGAGDDADRQPRARRCGRLRPFGWLAVGLVVVQALLGGITVMLRLPTPVSTAHTGTSLLFFLTWSTSRCGRGRRPAERDARRPRSVAVARLALVAAVAIFFQMVLGGLVRHSGAALACTDVPLCRGSLWPDAHPTVLIQALHRLTGVAVALLVFASSIMTLRHAGPRRDLRALALVAPVLVCVQIALGIARRDQLPRPRDGGGAPRRRDRAARDAGAGRAARRSADRARPRQRSPGSRAWSAWASRASPAWW